jgi:hypothetical protein
MKVDKMSLDELKQICEKAINYRGFINLPGKARITLNLPESKNAPRRRRIFGKSGPFGNVVAWGFDGYDTVIFDAQEVLDFIIGVQTLEGEA